MASVLEDSCIPFTLITGVVKMFNSHWDGEPKTELLSSETFLTGVGTGSLGPGELIGEVDGVLRMTDCFEGDPNGVDSDCEIERCSTETRRSSPSWGSCGSLLCKLLSVRLTEPILAAERGFLSEMRLSAPDCCFFNLGSRVQESSLRWSRKLTSW